MVQTYKHSNASLSRKEAKSEGKDISSWYIGKEVKSSKSKALTNKKGKSEGKVGNGSRTGVTKDNDNDPISRFHTA